MKKRISVLLAAVLTLSLLLTFSACDAFRIPADEEITTEPVVAKTPRPATKEDALNYFNTVINNVKKEKPAVNPKISKNIKDVETENDTLKSLVPTLKKYIFNTGAQSAKAGDDLKDIFPVKGQEWSSQLTLDDISYIMAVELGDFYEIYLKFNDESNPQKADSVLGKVFDLADKEALLDELKKADDYLEVNEADFLYNGCTIRCVVDKGSDRLTSITYFVNIRVDSSITGKGTLESDKIKDLPFAFTYEIKSEYKLDWEDVK